MNKNYSKFNNGKMIKLEDISKNELMQALNDFSEGFISLKKCLSAMWANELNTIACCAGTESSFDETYIMMDTGIDLFSYLSDDILSSDLVSIDYNLDNRQVISIIGPIKNKEILLDKLVSDILSGKKRNDHLIQQKIGKKWSREWQVNAMVYNMLKDSISKLNFMDRIKAISLIRKLNETTIEQQKELIQSCYSLLALIHSKEVCSKKR